MPEVHLIEICLQDLVLFVALLQIQRPVDLRYLALDGALVVAGDVLHQLLGDGGTALHTAAEQGAEDGAGGAVPVHALVGVEPLVLDGHHCVLQVLGDLVQIGPDAVLRVHEQRLVHDPFAALRLLIVQLRGDLRLEFVQIDLYLPPHAAVDVCGENTCEDGAGQHEHQQQRADDASRLLPAAAAAPGRPLLPVIVYVSGALLRPVGMLRRLSVSASFHHRAPSFLCYLAWSGLSRENPIKTHYKDYFTMPVNSSKTAISGKIISFPVRIHSFYPFPSLFSPVQPEISHQRRLLFSAETVIVMIP